MIQLTQLDHLRKCCSWAHMFSVGGGCDLFNLTLSSLGLETNGNIPFHWKDPR